MQREHTTDTVHVSDDVLYDLLLLSPRSRQQASRILYNLPSVIRLLQSDAAASTRFSTPWEDEDILDVYTGESDDVDGEKEGDKNTNCVVSDEINCVREHSRSNKHHSVLLKGAGRGVEENLKSIRHQVFLSQVYHNPHSLTNGDGRNGSRPTMHSSIHTP